MKKELSQELTYDELDKNIGNLWSVLFTTGYLTKQGRTADGKIRLAIPNKEIKIFLSRKLGNGSGIRPRMTVRDWKNSAMRF